MKSKCSKLVQRTVPLGFRGGRPLAHTFSHLFSHFSSRATFTCSMFSEWHFQELAGSFISLEAVSSMLCNNDCRLTDDEDVMMMA